MEEKYCLFWFYQNNFISVVKKVVFIYMCSKVQCKLWFMQDLQFSVKVDEIEGCVDRYDIMSFMMY